MATLGTWGTAIDRLTRGLFPRWWGQGRSTPTPSPAYDYGYLPGSKINYRKEAGPLALNSAIAACLGWMVDEWAKAVFEVQRVRADGTVEPRYGHELPELIDAPNPFDSADDLWAASVRDYVIDGNAYWIKVRGWGRSVAELWHVPAWRVEPYWTGDDWITGYEIDIDGTVYRVPTTEVIHFRDGKDAFNERKGVSRLKAGLRSVAGLNEAETITYCLLKSPAPGIVISKAAGEDAASADIGPANAKRLKAMSERVMGADNRFRVVVVETGLKVDQVGFSPEALRLDRLPILPESTVCALIGVSPLVVHLRSAAEHATYANGENARKLSWSRLQAIQGRMARSVTRQLLVPDFEPSKRYRCGWDYSSVDALQEDAAAKATRATLAFEKGLILRNEGREVLGGLDPLPPEFGEVFFDGSGPGAPEPIAPPVVPPPIVPPPPAPLPADDDLADEGDDLADEGDDDPTVPEPIKARMNGHAAKGLPSDLWAY
jgi:HK97 family phage portal protein